MNTSKSGFIRENIPSIVDKLNIDNSVVEAFQEGRFLSRFGNAIGGQNNLKHVGVNKGLRIARLVFVA